jgi:hypothetical protein
MRSHDKLPRAMNVDYFWAAAPWGAVPPPCHPPAHILTDTPLVFVALRGKVALVQVLRGSADVTRDQLRPELRLNDAAKCA